MRSDMAKATQRKKQAILSAATTLFSERGVNGTGIEGIAELAQVSRQSVYNYYGSKEGILQALLTELFQTTASQWRSHEENGPAPLSSMADLQDELFSFYSSATETLMSVSYLKLMRIVVAEAAGNPGIADQFRQSFAIPMMNILQSIFDRTGKVISAPSGVEMRFAIGPLLPYVLLDGLLQIDHPHPPGEDALRGHAQLVATGFWHTAR